METETVVDFVPTEAFTAFSTESEIRQAAHHSAQPTFSRFDVHADIPPIAPPKAIEPARGADEPFWSGVLIGGGTATLAALILYFLYRRLATQ